jgi:hypothetical protein
VSIDGKKSSDPVKSAPKNDSEEDGEDNKNDWDIPAFIRRRMQ